MIRFFLVLLWAFCFPVVAVFAQADSSVLPMADTSIHVTPPVQSLKDSFSRKPPVKDTGWTIHPQLSFSQQLTQHNPFTGKARLVETVASAVRYTEGKELLFYALVALLFVFALLKRSFPKYFSDLFRLFFRTTLKQRQIREQLMQTPLPSLLLNAFFVVSAALYIDFLLIYFDYIDREDFWLYFAYACMGLSAIYLVKFIGLKILGWIFNMRQAADAYIFVVFIINKVIGVSLLPFLIMLAFMQGVGYSIAMALSWFVIAVLLFYRFILTYAAVRNQVRFNPFHFFLYLCAFEIAPLLLIYKLLLVFFQ